MENSSKDCGLKRHLIGAMLVLVSFVMLVALAVSAYILWSAIHIFPLRADQTVQPTVETVIEANNPSQKLDKNVMFIQSSEITALEKRVKTLEYQDGRLVDDIRQETNNNINVLNGWLSFWIGILALMGVFIPLVFQYKKNKDDEQKMKEMQKQFQRQQDEYLALMNSTHLQSLVYSISNGIDLRLVFEGTTSVTLLQRLYEESLRCFDEIVHTVMRKVKSEGRRLKQEEASMLIISMLSMYKLYTCLNQPDVTERRAVDNCLDKLRNLMDKVNAYQRVGEKEINDNLKALLNFMYSVEIKNSKD
jgi:hypothetical protein